MALDDLEQNGAEQKTRDMQTAICLKAYCFLIIISLSLLKLVSTTSRKEFEKRLFADLLSTYDKRVKPSGVANGTLDVVLYSGIIQIIDVDEKNQILDGMYFGMEGWQDEELTWDPQMYGGVDLLMLDDDSIWMPTIRLFNDVDIIYSKKSLSITHVYLNNDGSVRCSYVVNHRSSCSMNLRKFPFDTQNCSLLFIPWRHHISMTPQGNMGTQHFFNSSEFELTDSKMTYYEVFDGAKIISYIRYDLFLRRRPLFYLLNIVLPCSLVALMAMLSFCVPPETGEKVGLGITVLLSLTVFLLVVNDMLPPTVDFPLIAIYFFASFLLVTFTTSLSVFTLSLHYSAFYKRRDVPMLLRKVCFDYLARWLCMRSLAETGNDFKVEPGDMVGNHIGMVEPCKIQQVVSYENIDTHVDKELPNNTGTEMNHDIREITRFIRRYEERRLEEKRQANYTTQWQNLSRVIDRLILVIFAVLNFIFFLWLITNATL